MQSVGEVMAIGRTFCESAQKALRSLEQGRSGLNADPAEAAFDALGDDDLLERVSVPTPERLFAVEVALRRGIPIETVSEASRHRPVVRAAAGADLGRPARARRARPEPGGGTAALAALGRARWRSLKRLGFSDAQVAYVLGVDEAAARAARLAAGVVPTFKTVDTCAAEFEAHTPYHYATYEDEEEVRPSERERVIILGSGPNRIGQGIEFDYCCVHAAMALRAAGYETVMVNCNPETVSTDYDTSDRLYFEPLTTEDVTNVIEAETRASRGDGRVVGVIVSLGGQTPLKLAGALDPGLVLGTSPASIDLAEDRQQWNELCTRLGIAQPPGAVASTATEALAAAADIGYPVLLRPSYVLGGRAMEIIYDDDGSPPRHGGAGRRPGSRGGRDGRAAGLGRPLLGGRHRGRRRRAARPHRRGADRRRDGARRGGGRALGGLGLRAPAPDTRPGHARHHRHPHPGAGGRARRLRPPERPVRGEGRCGLRPGGEPPRQPHGALRGQGDGGAGRRHRGRGSWWARP